MREVLDLNQLTPETLAALPERQFRIVVTADMRKEASNERVRTDVPKWISDELRGPLAARRLAVMRAMLANVEGQIEMRTNAFERTMAQTPDSPKAVATHHEELAGPLRFRSAVLEALPEAEFVVSNRVGELERAIAAHRAAIEEDDNVEASPADRALWATLT